MGLRIVGETTKPFVVVVVWCMVPPPLMASTNSVFSVSFRSESFTKIG